MTVYSQVIASDDTGTSDVSGPPDGLDTPVAVDQGGTNATVGSQGIINLLNSKPSGLDKWRAALAKVMAGAGNARLLYEGDSTIAGFGAATPNQLVTAPLRLATRLATQYGITVNVDCFMGDGANTAQRSTHDPRFTSLGSWVTAGSYVTLGGYQIACTAGTTPLVYQPYNQWDTITYWYWRQTGIGLGTLALTINGVTTNIDLNTGAATAEVVEVTYTVPAGLGAYSINLARVSGSVFILGWETRNSAVSSLQLYNCGWGGSASNQTCGTSTAYSPVPMHLKVAPDLVIIEGGINDYSAITPAQVVTNFATLAAVQETVGSIIYQTPFPGNPSGGAAPIVNQQAYADAIAAGALARNTGCINMYEAMEGGYAVWQPRGLYYDTFVHPSATGNAFMANIAHNAIVALT